MILRIDHIAVCAEDPDAAMTAYEALLGRPPYAQGRFRLGNMSLDIVEAAPHRSPLSLVFAATDMAETRRLLERRAAPSAEPDDEGVVWLDPAGTFGAQIGLVESDDASTPPAAFARDQVQALDHVVVMTANPERAVALYGARLGLDFRLDRKHPQWGARQIFMRCGDAVVEIAARLDAPVSDLPDRLSGLAWRVADPVAAQARIAAAGFDVSGVRQGRKPGTSVFTVRAGVPGTPALIIGATVS